MTENRPILSLHQRRLGNSATSSFGENASLVHQITTRTTGPLKGWPFVNEESSRLPTRN